MNLETAEQSLIFKCIAGSHAYGTNTPESDVDHRGVFAVPAADYICLNKKVEQVSDAKNDTTYYTIHRFLQLACFGNPNILELLWTPEDCVLIDDERWKQIHDIRQTFITKSVLDAFGGYAVAQIKRATGQNKLINNPISKEKPCKEDFCWIIPMCCKRDMPDDDYFCGRILELHHDYPFRPIKLSEHGINLDHYDCATVEHLPHAFRLYYRGKRAKGVFRGDDTADIVCESIPIVEEYESFSGILIYHKDAYERALRLWHQYWDWRKNRNEARWTPQEQDEVDVRFDRKNMMHCMRLLYSGENILEHGCPIVRFDGDRLQRLRDIRAGRIAYDDILQEAEERLAKLDEARKTCSLPTSPNFDAVNELSIRLHRCFHDHL